MRNENENENENEKWEMVAKTEHRLDGQRREERIHRHPLGGQYLIACVSLLSPPHLDERRRCREGRRGRGQTENPFPRFSHVAHPSPLCQNFFLFLLLRLRTPRSVSAKDGAGYKWKFCTNASIYI